MDRVLDSLKIVKATIGTNTNKVVDRVHDPQKIVKATSGTSTDNNDDTLSLLSFEDPVNLDDDMNIDVGDIKIKTDVFATVLPKYVPPPQTRVIGANLVATPLNSLLIYDPPQWVE